MLRPMTINIISHFITAVCAVIIGIWMIFNGGFQAQPTIVWIWVVLFAFFLNWFFVRFNQWYAMLYAEDQEAIEHEQRIVRMIELNRKARE